MTPNDNDGCFIFAALLAIGIPLAWICFLIWAVYTLVTWVTTK